ncbi:hypothetical protein PRK78_005029 [Emydomyces testavorans]|uniref:Zn(2)-C6 fungal-type domain-containing protein n=1 Tax=Emydomyces testavorans TaxID=2070801 RepID=A0AAF0DML5_9EURO|nr:hypothetical protein PRK78_005029 [Emydomyces testavorans]
MAEKSSTGTEPTEPHPLPKSSAPDATSAHTASTKVKGPRKRTKTGCLTCRKRRIKCGEEKPRCNNCIKSKRECEGYGQRVVFRDPVGPIPHLGPITSAQNLPGTSHSFINRQFLPAFHHGESSGARSFLPLAPRPSGYGPVTETLVRHEFTQHAASQPGLSHPISEEQHFSWNAIQYSHPQQQPALQDFSQGGQDPGTSQFDSSYHTGATYYSPTTLQHTESYQPHRPEADSRHYISSEPGTASDVPHASRHVVGMEPEPDLGAESDDYYDVESDGEMEESELKLYSGSYGHAAKMIPYQLMSRPGQFSAFESYENLLTTYRPSPLASPLLDPQVMQIFDHFLTVVGPAISIYERHPYIPSVTMSSGPVPPEQQNLWTYTLPTMALEHQGLLQAILAFSSLHLARMTNQPLTTAFRHYHYSLRRVGKAVGLPYRRKQIPTLAATLLLAYFEVMGAEHNKWNSHLAGATHLIREIDFAGMTRDIRAMRAKARSELWLHHPQDQSMGSTASYLGSYFENDIFATFESEIDMALISTLTGKAINYDEFGQVGSSAKKPRRDLTQKDVDDYRDRKRKLKVIEANGGEWRPPPNFFPPGMGGPGPQPPKGPPRGVPQTPSGQGSKPSQPKRESSPPMYGMVPPSGPIRLPSAFGSTVYPPPSSPSGSEGGMDLESMTAEAEAEWQQIVHACEEFGKALATPGFVPLPPDGAPLIASPFGPAIQYRTHVVACIWTFYYTARIILERVHPAMPPAAMVAAGVAAPRTAQYAQLIGRITAGVHHTQQFGVDIPNLHPTTVGVLNELMLPLFFAGVQYTDPSQRTWTIAKLRDIARVTGGTSPTAVASGCERVWLKAYELGRGPPYTRTVTSIEEQNRQGKVSETGDDRRYVTVPEGSKVTFAMGLLSLSEHMGVHDQD